MEETTRNAVERRVTIGKLVKVYERSVTFVLGFHQVFVYRTLQYIIKKVNLTKHF